MAAWFRRLLGSPPRVESRGPAATREDIAACFRLLLGREPNPEEGAGHMAQAGQPLAGVVAGYLNSLEYARRGLMQAELGAPSLAQRDRFALYAREADEAVGRHVLHGAYEPEVDAAFRAALRPGMGVIDLGANIGYFTMLAASLVGPGGFVLAVEPNPDNASLLEASRRHNGFEQVRVAQLAAGRKIGLLALNTSHSNGTTSEAGGDAAALLRARTVACVPVCMLLDKERRIDLIKVDVEGAEYNALLGAESLLRRDRPVIISEFSPDLMPGISGIDGPGYLGWLYGLGYGIAVLHPDRGPEHTGQDAGAVMAAYARRGTDHIDLLAKPLDHAP